MLGMAAISSASGVLLDPPSARPTKHILVGSNLKGTLLTGMITDNSGFPREPFQFVARNSTFRNTAQPSW
jgi:hypothetical protein